MTETANLKLKKPDPTDFYDIDDFNSNADKLEAAISDLRSAVDSKADKSAIPTTLPANGGNADTVGGKHADDFILAATGLNFSTSAKEYAETYKSGAENIEFTWRGYGAPDAPYTDGDWFFHAYRGDSNWIRIVAFDIRYTASYEIAKTGGSWGEWKKLADGGNAAQLGSIPASELDRVRYAVSGGVKDGVQWTGIDATKGDVTIRMQVDADYDKLFLFKSSDGQKTWQSLQINADSAATASSAGASAADAGTSCLRNLSSGTAEATTANCPAGSWYGKHS